jgi:hypothetical protein
MTSSLSQENFIDGLKQVVLDPPDNETKLKALKLLLFAAVLDGNLERVNFALNNGARANWGLDPGTRTILTNMGWSIPEELSSPESPDVSPEYSDQSLSSDEAYPYG